MDPQNKNPASQHYKYVLQAMRFSVFFYLQKYSLDKDNSVVTALGHAGRCGLEGGGYL